MSVVVVPGQFQAAPHPAGKLASTLLSVCVAGMTDPGRFRRGKTYVAQHAVSRLEVAPGRLVANVSGSESQPYRTVVTCNVLPTLDLPSADALRVQLARLTPDASDIHTSCTCLDDGDVCKHVVAALLALAGELVARPELLVQWRCAPSGTAPERPTIGSRARGTRPSERHLRLAPPPVERAPETSPWETPEWVAFMGSMPPDPPALPDERAGVGRAVLGAIDLAAVVRSALDELAGD